MTDFPQEQLLIYGYSKICIHDTKKTKKTDKIPSNVSSLENISIM